VDPRRVDDEEVAGERAVDVAGVEDEAAGGPEAQATRAGGRPDAAESARCAEEGASSGRHVSCHIVCTSN
jgi:hypothetical protein